MDWKDCKVIDETREEVVNQLDISLVFKRIQYFERFIEYIITDKEKIGLYLNEPPSIQEAKQKRMMAEYYDKVMQGRTVVLLKDLNRIAN